MINPLALNLKPDKDSIYFGDNVEKYNVKYRPPDDKNKINRKSSAFKSLIPNKCLVLS